jgi:hypothetical protein
MHAVAVAAAGPQAVMLLSEHIAVLLPSTLSLALLTCLTWTWTFLLQVLCVSWPQHST